MKLLLKSMCIAFVISVIYSVIPFQSECVRLYDDVFRLHVLADSDSEADQQLKLNVRDKVLGYTEGLFLHAESKEEAEAAVRENLQNIADVAAAEVRNRGYDYPVTAEIANMYFDTRRYSDYTLPSGVYDALRIKIGSGQGKNWWCVMYPSICLSAAIDADDNAKDALDSGEYNVIKNERYQYKFKMIEIFEKLRMCFTR